MKIYKDYEELIKDGTIKVDLGGHFGGRPVSNDFIAMEISMKLMHRDDEDCEISGSCLFQCTECGGPISFKKKGNNVTCTNPCKYPNGHPPIEFDLNVPSGKMVVGNDFRDAFKVMGDYDINLTPGIAQTTHKYAEVGLAHSFVGNTCPGVYRIDPKTFVIGIQDSKERNPVKGSRCVAGICTDLWWYSICDYDEFVRRYGREPDGKRARTETIVKCTPGVYHFRHVYHLIDHNNYEDAQIYTHIDWIREPDPVRDFLAEFEAQNFTAGQVLLDKITQWPDVYGKSIELAATRHIAQGDTRDYHPNGFLCDNPDLTSDSPDVEIPLFEGPFHGELDKHSFVCLAAGIGEDILGVIKDLKTIYLNESFTEVSFNLLHQILKYGVDDTSNGNAYVKDKVDGTPKWALRALKGLAKKYPERVPEYCKEFLSGRSSKNKDS
jgi:hypothetical protein